MGKKILVVFGATGSQGSSVINEVLNDPQLSKEFAIRGLSRDPSSSSSQELAKKGVEVVKCDNSESSIKEALKGAHTVFAMTLSMYHPNGHLDEIELGKLIADLTVAAGAQYIIWSSMVNPTLISDGKYPNVTIFWSKYDVEQYIRTLPIKSAYFIPASFMSNYQGQMKPKPLGDGTYGLFNLLSSESKIPIIAVKEDTGKWITPILAEPDKFAGKQLCAATKFYTQTELAEIISKVEGKSVKHIQLTVEKFESFGAPTFAKEMFLYMNEFGYYGADGENLVKWANEQARGKLTTFEEYLKLNPLNLDESAAH